MRTLPLLLPLVFACSGLFQSDYAGFTALCNAEESCPDCKDVAPEMQQQMLAKHVDALLGSNGAREAFDAIAYASPATRGKLLRHAAEEAGVTVCPLANSFDRQDREDAARTICDLPKCKDFDRTDIDTLDACSGELTETAKTELERMPDDRITLIRAIESYARSNGHDRCALVQELRKP